MRVILALGVLFFAYSGGAKADWVPIEGSGQESTSNHKSTLVKQDDSNLILRAFFKKRDKLIEAIDFYEYQELKGRVFTDFDGNIVSSLLRNDLVELEQTFDQVRPEWRKISQARDEIKKQMLALDEVQIIDGEAYADPYASRVREHLNQKLSGLFE